MGNSQFRERKVAERKTPSWRFLPKYLISIFLEKIDRFKNLGYVSAGLWLALRLETRLEPSTSGGQTDFFLVMADTV